MKNWQITGFLTILIIGFLLISGCTQDNSKYCSDNFPGTVYDPSTKMCEHTPTPTPTPTSQIVYVTVTVTPTWTPTPTITCSAPATVVPSYLHGSKDYVFPIKVPADGLRIFGFSYTGKGNFIVKLKDEYGDYDLLVNEIGTYSGRVSENLYVGKYYLEIKASGPYDITILDAWCV